MKNTFFLFSMISFVCQINAATIVFLRGPGSIGKTSMCKEIIKLDNNWKVIDEDEIYFEQCRLRWARLFPEHYSMIAHVIAPENIEHAIKRDQILFKSSATANEKEKAMHAIHYIRRLINNDTQAKKVAKNQKDQALREFLISQIFDYANLGYNVVVDTWFLNPADYDRFRNFHRVRIVLAYCRFETLIKRTIERNNIAQKSGNYFSGRFFHDQIESYLRFNELQQTIDMINGQQAIDILNKSRMQHECDLIDDYLINSPEQISNSSFREFLPEEFAVYKNKLLQKFGNGDSLYVVPKIKYDLLVCTDEKTPSQCAQQILNFVKT